MFSLVAYITFIITFVLGITTWASFQMNSWRLSKATLPRNLSPVFVTPNWILFPTHSAGNCAAKTLPPTLGHDFIHSLIPSFWGQRVFIEHLLGAKHWVENTIEN